MKEVLDNESLIELIKERRSIVGLKGPCDERVLDAIRKVDRREFLPNILTDMNHVGLFESQAVLNNLDDLLSKDNISEGEIDPFLEKVAQMIGSIQPIKVYTHDIAYNNVPIDIGYGQTCSEPLAVDQMEEELELEEGLRVLEVGAGCGYHAAITSHLLGKSGFLYTIECVPELVVVAKNNLSVHFGPDFEKRIKVIEGDGSVGLSEEAPFDRIYFTAGINEATFDTAPFKTQLREGGVLLYPPQFGRLIKKRYHEGELRNVSTQPATVGFVKLQGQNT